MFIGDTFLLALYRFRARFRRSSFLPATSQSTSSSHFCTSSTFKISCTRASFTAFNFRYFSSCVGQIRRVGGFEPVNNSIGHCMIPSLFSPNLFAGDWLMMLWNASTTEGHCTEGSFHSDRRAQRIKMTSRYSRSTVPFAQRQSKVLKWWITRASEVRLFMRKETKCHPLICYQPLDAPEARYPFCNCSHRCVTVSIIAVM